MVVGRNQAFGQTSRGKAPLRSDDCEYLALSNDSPNERSKTMNKTLCFKFQDSLEESKHLKKITEWVSPNLQESLSCVGEGVGLDLSNTKLGQALSGRKKTTLMMSRIPSIEWDSNFIPSIKVNEVPWNRLTRILGYSKQERFGIRKVVLKDGSEVDARIKVPYLELDGMPIIYVDFIEASDKDVKKQAAHEVTKDLIRKSFKVNDNEYEYLMSSGSQLRALKGVAVRKDYLVPRDILDEIEDLNYETFLCSLRGSEALLELLTYGAYSTEFTNMFASYLIEECGYSHRDIKEEYPEIALEEVKTSISKFMARAGMALTSSTPFGRDWSVKRIGLVRFKVDNIMTNLADMTFIDGDQKVKRYSRDELDNIEKFWKEEKLDGQNMVRASKVVATFKELYGYEMDPSKLAGELIQFRWAGVKGTALVVKDKYLDACRTPDGDYIYRGHDLIVEDSSWKYAPSRFYTGKIGPEFELVSISKSRYSSYLNYQFINALDGDPEDDTVTDGVKALIDESIESVRKAMYSQEDFLAKFGIVERKDEFMDKLGLNLHYMTIKSKSGKIVDVLDEAVHDPYIRRKLLENFKKGSDEISIGKIEVEGANRYIISDPSAMLRTDLAVKGEDGLWHIILDNPNQVAMRKSDSVYWNGKDEECVLFRSPCVHPGEPQRMNLIPNLDIPKVIPTGYGDLPVGEIFEDMNNIVVLNGWCNALESLGGADTDGDTVLCVTDERVVGMRNFYRPTHFADVPSETLKEVLNKSSLKENMVYSLKDNGIGLITNYATTWRDIQLYAKKCMKDGLKLPKNVEDNLSKVGKAAAANIKLDKDWVSKDKSLSPIAELALRYDNYSDYLGRVNSAASAALAKLRELQEMAINTAKSGIFVEFNSEDEDTNNLNHLCIRVRASWHKPTYKKALRYDSLSPMGIANSYARDKWKDLTEEAQSTAQSMFPGADTYFDAELLELVEMVSKVKALYGTKVNKLTLDKKNKKLTEEEFSLKFGDLTEDMHAELMSMAKDYGIDVVALIAYDITYKSAKKNGKGASFVWNCFFEEFLHTVKLNRDQGDEEALNQRLYPISLLPSFMYITLPSGQVEVVDQEVFMEDVKMGRCDIEDGTYDMVSIDSNAYIKKVVKMATPKEMTEFIKTNSTPIRLTGFRYNDDLVRGGKLTKEKVEEYLTNDMGQNIVRIKTINLDKFSDSAKIGLFIRYNTDEEGNPMWMFIGVLSIDVDEMVWTARALNNKIAKVSITRGEKEYASMLRLSVDQILVDELQ